MTLRSVANFFEEARRRRVYVSVVAYVVVAAGLIEVAEPLTDALMLPHWTPRLVTILLILGLFPVLVLSWIFDIGTSGVKRTPAVVAGGGKSGGLPRVLNRDTILPRFPVRRPKRVMPAHDGASEAPVDPARVRKVALGHMRHELRTPVNGILGYTEMVLEEVDDPAITEDLNRIRKAGHELLVRVDELLAPDALGGAGERELSTFGARVRADLRTPLNAITGYVEIVMKAASEAGRDDLQGDLARIRAAAGSLLEVTEDIVKIATSTMGDGSGRPGTLDRSSELARHVLARIQSLESRKSGEGLGGDGRILVVDDNAMNRDLLCRGLARAGYMVAEAESGEDALELIADQSFDVILLDVIMPGLDGVETLQRIRSDERFDDTPVIMLSSLDEIDSVIRCIEIGAEEYLVKPVPPPLLAARMATNVELRTMRTLGRAYHDRIETDEAFIDALLGGTFPSAFRERIRAGERDVEEHYPEATALCCVFGRGGNAVPEIRSLYARVEALAADHGVELTLWRPKMFVALADPVGEEGRHARIVGDFANSLKGLLTSSSGQVDPVPFRIGVHTGSASAGVVGLDRFRFELWGEAVELAEGVALQAPASMVLVTPPTRTVLADSFLFKPRGIVELEGHGQMRVFFLTGPSDHRAAQA